MPFCVGVDARTFLTQRASGVGIYTQELLKNLFELDSVNEYVLFSNAYSQKNPARAWYQSHHIDWSEIRFPNKVLNTAISLTRQPYLDRLAVSASARHTPIDLFFAPNWMFLALSPSVKFVLTVHDLAIFRAPHLFSARQRAWHWFAHIPYLLKRADALIAVSDCTKADLMDIFHIPESRIVVIPEGARKKFFPLHDHMRIQSYKKKRHLPERFVLSVGDIEPRKNPTALIRSLELLHRQKKYQDVHLVFSGKHGWNRAYTKRFDAMIKKSALSEKILWLSYVPEDELNFLYNAASVFAFPSWYEGFGLPVLEAFSAGVPVVASFAPAVSETAGGAAVLVDPANAMDMATAFAEILEHDGLRQTLSEAGIARAEEFSWRSCAAQTLKVFESVLQKEV